MAEDFNRRGLLQYAAFIAVTAMLPRPILADGAETTRFIDYPFKLGVASGDPLPNGFIIWTRLAPNPFDTRAIPQSQVKVAWEVSEDEKFTRIVRSGVAIARAQNAHSVHVEVVGLKPQRTYFYRFHAGKEGSPIGISKTAPLIGAPTDKFRFATTCCQSITEGHFAGYWDMVLKSPDLIIHTGDYVYEQEWFGGVRRAPVEEAFNLDEYRKLYARYKLDASLQAAHASAPWLMIWDDHEVEDDWGGSYSPDFGDTDEGAERFVQRKAAAFKAYFEHLPLRLEAKPNGPQARLYQRTIIGDLIQFDLLDCRQYRDNRACKTEKTLFKNFTPLCEEAVLGSRSLLGHEQEAWLARGLGAYDARWNAIVQTTMFSPFDIKAGPDAFYDMDGWDAFSANRQRIIDLIVRKEVRNPISLGGNIHAYYTGVVTRDPFNAEKPEVLNEIVCTSLSSGGGGDGRYHNTIKQLKENPNARFFENRRRGYVMNKVTHKEWESEFRVVDNVFDPKSKSISFKRATVESGKVEVSMD